jgi:hypothetical protein
MATPCGGKGAGTTTVPDDDRTTAAASRDAVATNAMITVSCWGARDLRAVADGMDGFMITCLVLFDCQVGLGQVVIEGWMEVEGQGGGGQ